MTESCGRCYESILPEDMPTTRILQFQYHDRDNLGSFRLCRECYHDAVQFILEHPKQSQEGVGSLSPVNHK